MSLLEVIAAHTGDYPERVSLPELLAEQALGHLSRGHDVRTRLLVMDFFRAAVMEHDPGPSEEYVALLRENGVSRARILHDYIPTLARQLGDDWCNDDMSFVEVTCAMGHLVALARDLSFQDFPPLAQEEERHSILLALEPGGQHALGLIIVAEKFRKAGWQVQLELDCPTVDDLAGTAAARTCDVIGLSVGSSERIEKVAETVARLRIACPQSLIVLGGSIAEEYREVLLKTGVDLVLLPQDDAPAELRRHILHLRRD